MTAAALLSAYVDRHNAGVAVGDFQPLADLFASASAIHFHGLAVGPFAGPAAILDAFRSHPPDDTLLLDAIAASADQARAAYRWSRVPDRIAGHFVLSSGPAGITLLDIHVY